MLIGIVVGYSTITLPAGQQYGMYRKELGFTVPEAAFRTAQSVFNKLFRKY